MLLQPKECIHFIAFFLQNFIIDGHCCCIRCIKIVSHADTFTFHVIIPAIKITSRFFLFLSDINPFILKTGHDLVLQKDSDCLLHLLRTVDEPTPLQHYWKVHRLICLLFFLVQSLNFVTYVLNHVLCEHHATFLVVAHGCIVGALVHLIQILSHLARLIHYDGTVCKFLR